LSNFQVVNFSDRQFFRSSNFQIVNWDLSGKLFYDFINVDLEVQKLVSERDEASVGYHIEQVIGSLRFATFRLG
jgi:hypothetical protein